MAAGVPRKARCKTRRLWTRLPEGARKRAAGQAAHLSESASRRVERIQSNVVEGALPAGAASQAVEIATEKERKGIAALRRSPSARRPHRVSSAAGRVRRAVLRFSAIGV